MMQSLLKLDQVGLYWINHIFTNSFLDWFFPRITDLHDTLFFKFVLVPALLVTLVYFQKKRGLVIFLMALVTVGLSDFVGNQVFKETFQRPRPHTVAALNVIQRSPSSGYSFISNHAVNMFTFATYFASFFPQFRVALYAVATLVAYSRVYNGAHYPSDILAGAVVGLLIGLLMSWVTRRLLSFMEARR